MRTQLMVFYLGFILLFTGCAINPPISGPQALTLQPTQPAQTGATNADQPAVNNLTNTH